jgi:hypothetical protein
MSLDRYKLYCLALAALCMLSIYCCIHRRKSSGAGFDGVGIRYSVPATVTMNAPVYRVFSESTPFVTNCVVGCYGVTGKGLYAAQVPGTIYQIELLWPTDISINKGRYWNALTNGTMLSLLSTDYPAAAGLSGVGIRYSTIAGDTYPVCVTFDGVVQTVTIPNPAITPTSIMKIEYDDGGARGWTTKVNDIVVCGPTRASIPASGTILAMVAGETPKTANTIEFNFYGFQESPQ